MKAIGIIVTTLLLIVYATVLNGWAFAKLWAWFIVPQFETRPISIPTAIGIAILVQFLTHQSKSEKDDESFFQVLCEGAFLVTAKVCALLLIGVIVKMFL